MFLVVVREPISVMLDMAVSKEMKCGIEVGPTLSEASIRIGQRCGDRHYVKKAGCWTISGKLLYFGP